jgi:hypothetical protein
MSKDLMKMPGLKKDHYLRYQDNQFSQSQRAKHCLKLEVRNQAFFPKNQRQHQLLPLGKLRILKMHK